MYAAQTRWVRYYAPRLSLNGTVLILCAQANCFVYLMIYGSRLYDCSFADNDHAVSVRSNCACSDLPLLREDHCGLPRAFLSSLGNLCASQSVIELSL